MKKRMLCLLLSLTILAAVCLPVRAGAHPFVDVADDAWYSESVEYVYLRGLMAGTGDDTFSPEGTMTRAMTVTVLYRLAGSPDPAGACPFADVAADAYYYSAVCWAVEQGITAGTSADAFSPEHNVTREQLVTFLYRYAATVSVDMSYKLTSLTGFSDTESVSGYALVPFAWCVTNGIITGTDEFHLSPSNSATRAQCAAILARFDRLVNG